MNNKPSTAIVFLCVFLIATLALGSVLVLTISSKKLEEEANLENQKICHQEADRFSSSVAHQRLHYCLLERDEFYRRAVLENFVGQLF